jgi:hypothetical protein
MLILKNAPGGVVVKCGVDACDNLRIWMHAQPGSINSLSVECTGSQWPCERIQLGTRAAPLVITN